MSNPFSYSILTYKHSLFLGEVLNVGVLFVFPSENIVEFHYPKKINRLKGLYNDFNENVIRDYLKAFSKKSKTIDLNKYIFGYNDIITENFIVEDSSALQFENFRSGIYYSTIEEVKSRYIDLILGNYNSEITGTTHKITDDVLVRNLKAKVFELNPQSKDLIKVDNKRILKNKHIQFKSDFYWKNGVINYTKALSFDLSKEESIINKSILINGQLRQLENSFKNDTHIDIVIQEPLNNQFSDVVSEAKTILDQNAIDTRIFNNWEEYSKIVASTIKPIF